jgi:Tfp pilus assembly protein PilF
VSGARFSLLLFGGALAVRLLHVAVLHGGPLFRYLLIDSAFYDGVGRALAAGAGFPPGPFFMNVLYGAFLGAMYSLFGSGEGGRLAVLLLQSGLGALSCVLLVRLGEEVGRPGDGRVAGALLAVFGPAIFYDAALLTPSLLLFLTLAATLVAARLLASPRPLPAAALGLLVGLLVLGRANHLLLLLGLVLLLVRRGRPGLVAAGVTTAVALLLVAPVTVRNARESGELVLVTANGGMALWAGNHPGATGIYSEPGFLSNPVPEREAEDYRIEASRRAGRELTLAESSRWWQRATVSRWVSEPLATARLMLEKLRFWFHATESQTNLSYYLALDFSPVLWFLRINLGWVLPFAIVGLARDARRLPVVALPIAVSLVTCLLFYVSSEYRHPVVPMLLLFGVAGGRWALGVVRTGTPARRVAVVAGLLALLVVVNFRDPFVTRLQSRRVDYVNFGTLASDAGDLALAEQLFRESIRIDPAWPVSRRKLADVYQRTGRVAEAAEESRRAALLEGEVPTDANPLRAAAALFREQRFGEAKAAFLEIAGGGGELAPGALNNAGLCAMNLGQTAEADSLFRAARAADPTYASPVIHRGRLALALGDSTAAEAFAREALELAPADGRAQRLLLRARGDASVPDDPEDDR